MRFSIIMPSYNTGPYIRTAIESVLGQTYAEKELIVIDGGSTDETLDILRSYGERIIWISEKDRGQADAINKGLKKASGEIVTWLNADDSYQDQTLSKVAGAFEANPALSLVYGNCRSGVPGSWSLNVPPHTITARRLIQEGNLIYQPASFYRRKIVETVGGIDDTLHIWMEYDLFIKLLQNGEGKYINETLANFTIRNGQKSDMKNLLAMKKEILMISKRYGGGGLFSRVRAAYLYQVLKHMMYLV